MRGGKGRWQCHCGDKKKKEKEKERIKPLINLNGGYLGEFYVASCLVEDEMIMRFFFAFSFFLKIEKTRRLKFVKIPNKSLSIPKGQVSNLNFN